MGGRRGFGSPAAAGGGGANFRLDFLFLAWYNIRARRERSRGAPSGALSFCLRPLRGLRAGGFSPFPPRPLPIREGGARGVRGAAPLIFAAIIPLKDFCNRFVTVPGAWQTPGAGAALISGAALRLRLLCCENERQALSVGLAFYCSGHAPPQELAVVAAAQGGANATKGEILLRWGPFFPQSNEIDLLFRSRGCGPLLLDLAGPSFPANFQTPVFYSMGRGMSSPVFPFSIPSA